MASQDNPEVFDQSFNLYLQGEYQKAYDLLTEAAPKYPDNAQRIYEWRFDLAAKMGKLELAEEILRNALEDGCAYGEFALRKDDDMQVMQGRPVFEALVARSYEILAEMNRHSQPQLEMINPGSTQDGKIPLLISLHGNNSNIRQYRHYWTSLQGSEWLVALPQSSQAGGKDIYVWNGMEIAEKELRQHFQVLSAKYPVDESKVIISGFSKGGHAAIQAALKGIFPISGFIAIAPYIPKIEEMLPLLDSCPNRNLRGYLLLGAADELCLSGAQQLHAEISKRGFACGMEVFPGLGHDFPADFDRVLPRVIDFVLNR